MTRTIIEGGHVATVDASGTEHRAGHVVIDDGVITAVGRRPRGRRPGATARMSSTPPGASSPPVSINTHHHLYQWLTRGYAQDSILFDWLTSLYPLWSRIDADLTGAGAAGAMAVLARSGCTTVGDHHYIFPQGVGRHRRRRSSRPHRTSGCAFTRPAARWTSVHRRADCRPTSRWRPRMPRSRPRRRRSSATTTRRSTPSCSVAIAPCSPFSVTSDLLREAAVARPLARRAAAHARVGDGGRGRLLPRELRQDPDRVPRGSRLARRRRVDGALRPPRRHRDRAIRRDRHRRRALPFLQRAARVGHRPGPRHAARGRAGRPRRRRCRVERVGPARHRGARGGADEPPPHRRRLVQRPGRSAHRDDGRRARARTRTPRSARSNRASSPTSRSGGSTASSMPASSIPSPLSDSAHSRRCIGSSSAAVRSSWKGRS